MRFTIQCAVSCSYRTLLAPPNSARGDLYRARLVCRGGSTVFVFENYLFRCANVKCLLIHVGTHQSAVGQML